MYTQIGVVGHGRLGSAVLARLAERRLAAPVDNADLVLLCVPDRAIHEAAGQISSGPWVAHMSGAVPLSALAPHQRRFGLHPLQTFRREGGAAQLDGAWATVEAHLAAIQRHAPEVEELYRAMARATRP